MVKCCSCLGNEPRIPNPYSFSFNGSDKTALNESSFESNSVHTSKYNAVTFVPFALLLQFKRLANVYFLVIGILQTVPQISPLSPATAWAPLILVIGISMLREGLEDYSRYKSDKISNALSETKIRRDGKFELLPWSKVVVGDVVMVENGEMFPADLILLASSIEGGNAYIETASLDGEKNLKPRMALKETAVYNNEQALKTLQGECTCAEPDKDLHNFQASITIQGKKIVIEGDKQLLYRGAKLKNTKWIYGLVVYTGHLSKIMLNSESTADKMSQVERKVNILLIGIFLLQIVLCCVCAVCYGLTQPEQRDSWYLDRDNNVPVSSLLIFLSYLVLLNTMIPISLIVSLQLVKVAQGYFIQKDALMFNQRRQKGATVFSTSLNEELGQIQYVFTDKTGTLTCNIMEFKIAVIGDRMFGDRSLIIDNKGDPAQLQVNPPGIKGFYDQQLNRLLQGQDRELKSLPAQHVIRYEDGKVAETIKTYRDLAEEYMLLLATAHECVVEEDKEKNLVYQGPSPDEITLVDAAKNMGFVYSKADNQYAYLKIQGKEERFEVLGTHSFTSDRKRMSVLIRHNGNIKLFVKGADSIVKKRLAKQQPFLDTIDKYLNVFAVKGLRTLLIAQRAVSQLQYNTFRTAQSQLPQQGRAKLREQLISGLQQNLQLVGATAVLDRLQDNVPETIRDLIRANIKVWMLTGDKMQTAENIGMSCNLIQSDFKVLKYHPRTTEYLKELQSVAETAAQYKEKGVKKAFLIQGEHIAKLMLSEDCKLVLAGMAEHCEAVICCRLLPAQKAEVVDLVRKYLNKITLSIGDGANDVPMIKMAHIGIGLYGEEGMGAVQASDYALPQFQGLWRLLLVHGRWNYIRIAEMILYFFYKNMVFTIPQFYFAFFCSFSAQSIFNDMYISLYNIVFTSIPLIIRAILQQDVYFIYRSDGTKYSRPLQQLPRGYEQKQTLKVLFPKIYYVGQKNCIFNYGNLIMWLFEAMCEALLITMICMYVLGQPSINQHGYNSNLGLVSVTVFSSIILVVSFKIATHTRFWSWLMFLSLIVLSIGLYITYMWISNSFSELKGVIPTVFTTFETYLCVFFSVGVLMLLDGMFVFGEFRKGGYASKMRKVIEDDRASSMSYFDELSLQISENVKPKPKLFNAENAQL